MPVVSQHLEHMKGIELPQLFTIHLRCLIDSVLFIAVIGKTRPTRLCRITHAPPLARSVLRDEVVEGLRSHRAVEERLVAQAGQFQEGAVLAVGAGLHLLAEGGPGVHLDR